MRRRVLLIAGAALVLAVAAGVYTWRARTGPTAIAGLLPPREVRAPDSVRIRVEVVNATRTRGLARRATLFLRDRGFDVVDFSTTSELRDSVLVLDRSGNAEWAELVARALGGARVESRPDTSRYLDVTVLLGASWRPPAQPFHP